ncbi:unnamed protein product [Angiostrongylus costaricensis]|uniref:Alginate_lyase2 domain-containing protein n=1 Tax=Angiostrongylus costaricensis TaxID=334426 RepID=A0A0R3PCT1_ANGCS|nr:unnamed protein product [Angiostrongylus costaricensis]
MKIRAILWMNVVAASNAVVADKTPSPLVTPADCTTLKNANKSFLNMNMHDRLRLESCVFTFLTDTELKFNANPDSFHTDPPPEAELTIQVDDVVIRHVQLSSGSTYQFQIYGDIYLVNRPVSVQNLFDRAHGLSTLADEHSAWVVDVSRIELFIRKI